MRLAGELRPDVAVLDVQMPGVNGIEATRQIKAAYPEIRVLILTAYDEDPYVFALLHAGADGYILKKRRPRRPGAGRQGGGERRQGAGPDIAAEGGGADDLGKPAAAAEQVEPLTERELDVLRLGRLGA